MDIPMGILTIMITHIAMNKGMITAIRTTILMTINTRVPFE